MYEPINLNVSTDQHDRLRKAIQSSRAVSIKVNSASAKGSKSKLLLTPSQIQRIERARLIGKQKVSIHLSKKQVKANIAYKGGFLATLASLAARALPTILGGLTTGLLSGGIEKAISGRGVGGDGLYLHKSGHSLKITPIRGKGIQLVPKKCKGIHGDGLFLKRGSKIYDGRGLLLGKNSPFKNIPILGLLL